MATRSFIRHCLRLPAALVGVVLIVWPAPGWTPVARGDEPSADARGLELFVGLRDVLVHRCAGCHGAGSDTHEGGLDLSTRETLLAGGGRGPAIVAGRSAESLLYRLAAKLEEPHMPEEGDPLSAEVLARLAEWIDRGAPYDRPLIDAADRRPWTERTIDPALRGRWPFLPLAPVAVPAVDDPDGWCRNPIDRFILARIRESGLAPAPMADRRTLRRRLAADLTGLPATPGEVRAFVDDRRDEAYEQEVDDLLGRPAFGERQAQPWLDVARYAESFGYEQDYDRPHAHPYRDFVVSAFNDDLPFDTFLRWQLAGDELAPDVPAARIATGFLAAGAFPTQLTEKEFESARSGELDDIVSTIGTAMLGLTVGCARCHDHKFDPLPQADYYRLAATFTATVRSNVEIEIFPERHAAALAAWQAEVDRAIAARRRIEEELPARFDDWITSWQPTEAGTAPAWRLGRLVSAASRVGSPLTALADGSLLAGGPPANEETYTIELDFPLDSIASLRLDALADPSLPKGGPGRVAHGNFALSNITVAAAPIPPEGSDADFAPVKLGAPRADYSQPSLDITHAIDDSPTSGWAIDPHVGQSHVALFDFVAPVAFPGGCRLRVTLDFRTSPHHAIGRPRLAAATVAELPAIPVTADADPIDSARSNAARVSELVALPLRTPAQTLELRRLQAGYDEAWRAADSFVRAVEGARPTPEKLTALVAGDHLTPIPHHADGRGYPHAYPETWFLRRGDVRQHEGVATAGFLQVLSRAPEGTWRRGEGKLEPPGEGRRASLARWITDPEAGAGSLAARVIVNRIWQQYFGTGLVATPSDFGAQADPPSHPELLEWLAGELVRGGWHLKSIHRLIVTSATYRQSSTIPPRALAVDPRNRLLSHFGRRRLDAEGVRDALLAISGALDATIGGRGGADDRAPRRSLYLDVKRSRPSPFLRAFDAPDRVTGMGKRSVTTTAPQVLLLMNGPAVRGWAETFAARVLREPHRFTDEVTVNTAPIHTAYALALGRAPTTDELAEAVTFLDSQTATYAAEGREQPAATALADFCQVLLGLNETLHVE